MLHALRREYRVRGFDEVITPQVFAKDLGEISGHWQNYKEAHARTRQHARARAHAKRTTPLHTRTHACDARTLARTHARTHMEARRTRE
jgi:threonyl-tRNA synthetase